MKKFLRKHLTDRNLHVIIVLVLMVFLLSCGEDNGTLYRVQLKTYHTWSTECIDSTTTYIRVVRLPRGYHVGDIIRVEYDKGTIIEEIK
jgi:hypothetical protein